MTDVSADLSNRPAGYGVALECLRLQASQPPRSRLAKLFGFDPVHPDAVSYLKGTLGEIEVGRTLVRLGPEWTVIHAVPAGSKGRDIDHLVIGPAGVFSLNTKRHRGKKVWVAGRGLLVAGQRTTHIVKSVAEGKSAVERLSVALGQLVAVRPVLVIVGAQSLTIKSRPDEVTVLEDAQLLRWLKKQKTVLDPDVVARLAGIASDSRTWLDTSSAEFDGTAMTRFADLRRLDTAAFRIRTAWQLFWIAIGVTLLVTVGPPLLAAIATSFFAAMTPG